MDIITEFAKKLFKTDNPTPEQRHAAKTIKFGEIYGASNKTIGEILDRDLAEKSSVAEFRNRAQQFKKAVNMLASSLDLEVNRDDDFEILVYDKKKHPNGRANINCIGWSDL